MKRSGGGSGLRGASTRRSCTARTKRLRANKPPLHLTLHETPRRPLRALRATRSGAEGRQLRVVASVRKCSNPLARWHASEPSKVTDGTLGAMGRITVNPKQMGGVPCIRGLRIPVATVVNMVAGGMSPEEIVDELPPLDLEDVAAALRFAADSVADREIPLQSMA